MISKLANEVYEGWRREGLAPSLEMCVDLNAAGLEMERNAESAGFASAPRVAFLGDFIFREPTVRKLAYFDDLAAIIGNDDEARFNALAYVCHVPERELVPLDGSRRRVRKAVAAFVVRVLGGFTHSQALAAVSYAVAGADPDEVTGAYADGAPRAQHPADPPKSCRSYARAILAAAVGQGFDAAACGEMTAAALERILAAAALDADGIRQRDAERAARFYQIAGRCRARMLEARAAAEKAAEPQKETP